MGAADDSLLNDDDEAQCEDYVLDNEGDEETVMDDDEQHSRSRTNDNELKPGPMRRSFSPDRYVDNPSFMSWYQERYPSRPSITQELVFEWQREMERWRQKQLDDDEYICRRLAHPKFEAWFGKHYPGLDRFDALHENRLTREMADKFTASIGLPDLDEFCEVAFDPNIDAEWPQEFRRWAKSTHGVNLPTDVTSRIVDDWNAYNDTRNREHAEKAEIDFDQIDRDEWRAGADEWIREGNRDLTFVPNTNAEWAALLRRRSDRIAREVEQARRKTDQEKAAAAKRRHREVLVAELKKIKTNVEPVQTLATTLIGNSDLQDNYDRKLKQLWSTWRAQFVAQSEDVKAAWQVYYDDAGEIELEDFYIVPRQEPLVTLDTAEAVAAGVGDPAFREFQRFTASIGLAVSVSKAELHKVLHPARDARPALKAWSRSEIIKRPPERWLIPGLIQRFPVIYGPPKEWKSAWVQKLSVCIALGVAFDGFEVPRGRVLYITRDMGAGAHDVQDRCDEITQRMGFDPAALEDTLQIADGRFYLNEPASVAALLAENPGHYTAVIIDTLMRCVNGSVVQDSVASAALDGVETIQDVTGGAVIAVHHSPRGALHLFGSVVLDAALDAQLSVQRDRDTVTVKVERVKNDSLPKCTTYVYRREGALLVPAVQQPKAAAVTPLQSSPSDRSAAILALMPDTSTREETVRSLVEHLLGSDDDKPATKRQRWCRVLKALERDGLITRHHGMVQRRPAVA